VQFIFPFPTSEALSHHYPSTYYAYQDHSVTAQARWITWMKQKRFDRNSLVGGFFRFCFRPYSYVWKYAMQWPAGSRVLDVGCGGGQSLALFKRLSWETHGTDASSHACDAARQAGVDHVYCGHLDQLPIPDNYFDLVVIANVIEHVPNPMVVLQRIGAALKPGGTVLMIFPNSSGFSAGLFGPYRFNIDVPRHLWQFNHASLKTLIALSTTTLTVKRIRTSSQVDDYLWSLRFWIEQRGWTTPRANRTMEDPPFDAPWNSFLRLIFTPISFCAARLGLGNALWVTLKKIS